MDTKPGDIDQDEDPIQARQASARLAAASREIERLNTELDQERDSSSTQTGNGT